MYSLDVGEKTPFSPHIPHIPSQKAVANFVIISLSAVCVTVS